MKIESYEQSLAALYGLEAPAQRQRYGRLLDSFVETFGQQKDIRLFSAPGRSEIIGNHTDHQHGCAVAAAVNLDAVAAAVRTENAVICVQSQGYPLDRVELDVLEPVEAEAGTSAALVRGMAGELRRRGYEIGGFDAYTVSQVLKG